MKAMILAAGFGTRMEHLTQSTPKCLVSVHGVTMLERVIQRLKEAGVTEIVINLHYLADKVEAFLHRNRNFGVQIELSREAELLGTGGGLRNAQSFFSSEQPFILHNADIYSTIPLRELYDYHCGRDNLGTLAIMQRETSRYLLFDEQYALVGWESLRANRREFAKDYPNALHTNAIQRGYCGVCVLSPQLFTFMQAEPPEFSIITTFMKAVRSGATLEGFDVSSYTWLDVGTPQHLSQLESLLSSHR